MAMPPHSRAGGSSTAQRGATAASSSTSQTTTIRSPSTRHQQPVLRLRGAMRSPGERTDRRIQWAEDVIDNEGLGRKSSKGMPPSLSSARTISNNDTVCCIYHPPKASIDDSSDESSSDSSSESDSDDGSARPAGGKRRADARHKHNHEHDPSGECHHDGKTKKSRRSRSPNAYEKIPKPKESRPA